jgi:hypothetical protein
VPIQSPGRDAGAVGNRLYRRRRISALFEKLPGGTDETLARSTREPRRSSFAVSPRGSTPGHTGNRHDRSSIAACSTRWK